MCIESRVGEAEPDMIPIEVYQLTDVTKRKKCYCNRRTSMTRMKPQLYCIAMGAISSEGLSKSVVTKAAITRWSAALKAAPPNLTATSHAVAI